MAKSPSPSHRVIKAVFKSVTQRSRNVGFLSPQFQQLMTQYDVDPVNAYLITHSSIYINYMRPTSRTTYQNPCTNKNLFILWFIQDTEQTPKDDEGKNIKRTAEFTFNAKCKSAHDEELTIRFKRYIPLEMDDVDTNTPGFMKLFFKKIDWFAMVPLFMKIQKDIERYQDQCQLNHEPIKVHNCQTKHIRIENCTFKKIVQHLNIQHREL